jgi:hypothetical protein
VGLDRGKYDEAVAFKIYEFADGTDLAQKKSFMVFRGKKWFDYHAAMLSGFMQWRALFSDTTKIDKTLGPDPPSYFAKLDGSLASPVYRYVRPDEYTSIEQVGKDIHPWHIAGHGSVSLDGNKAEGAALPAATALPNIGSPANNCAAAKNILWDWHGRLDDFKATVPMAAAPATSTAAVPADGANPVPKGLTTILITFDKSVSLKGPDDANAEKANKSCARDNSLQLTPPGGGAVVLSTKVEWDGSPANPKKLKFTIPALDKAGEWTVKLPGNARGFKDVNFKFTIK